MDPKLESALRHACDQLGLAAEQLLPVVASYLGARLHAAVVARQAAEAAAAPKAKAKAKADK